MARNACTQLRMADENMFTSALRAGLRAVPPIRTAVRSLRDFANRESRALVRMYRRHGDQVLQPYPTTFEDRYPAVFDALANHLVHIPEPLILSYGCSDGSEVRSLRRWFPHARIVGLDPNALMIGKAREHLARHPDAGINYVEASSPSALGDMRFDAILAMAVFRHGELERTLPASCATVLPFERFARAIDALDDRLKPGGWLTIWNAHFRFGDTRTAQNYDGHALDYSRGEPQTLLYGPDNRRIDGADYADILFRKRG